jgi:GC-rich sequence DNA-binding factor
LCCVGVAKQNTSVELDEFGRDKNQLKEEARKRRMANCAGRKRRRKEKKDKSLGTSPEGLSTDDEEIESDLQRMALEIGNIKKEVDELFDDVVEDFCSLPVIMKHFEEWKFSRDKTYTEAFIPLSAQKVFVPFVRREMVFWNPLESQCKEIEDYEWFRTLLFYGHVWESTPLESDEDNLLLPNLVESVILTKMTGLVEKVWDPLSSAQTKRLVSCIEGLQREFPTISPLSKPLQGLYQAILLRLRRCLDADVYIPLYSKQQLENPSSLHHQFYQGQFWKAVKLFGNICLWATALSGGIRQIRELAVDGLLNRYLIMALQNMPPLFANVEKLSKLIGLIPRDWLEEELGVQFSSLTRCAIHLADGLYQSTIGHPDHERRKVKSSVQTLSKLLKTLRAEEEVEKLLSAYSI